MPIRLSTERGSATELLFQPSNQLPKQEHVLTLAISHKCWYLSMVNEINFVQPQAA